MNENVARVLLALDEANLDTVSRCLDESEVRIYRLGFAAAIRVVATALDVSLPNVRVPPVFTVINDESMLLPFQLTLDK